jgi:hypothetical protein
MSMDARVVPAAHTEAHLPGLASGLEPAILLHPAIVHLWTSFRLAQTISATDPARCQWEFAVELAQLRHLGLSDTHLRWLVLQGYVEYCPAHAPAVHGQHNGHSSAPRLHFDDNVLVSLSTAGAALVESLNGAILIAPATSQRHNGHTHPFPFDPIAFPTTALDPSTVAGVGNDSSPLVPVWDSQRRELRFAGKLVKQFKWPAHNQETILAAFQEEGWPPRIDDPLSPTPEIDPKRRLHDTIKCLNRNQNHRFLHFRGDGTGEGVIYDIARQSPYMLGK